MNYLFPKSLKSLYWSSWVGSWLNLNYIWRRINKKEYILVNFRQIYDIIAFEKIGDCTRNCGENLAI